MVELVDHPALVEGQIQVISALPTVALDRVEAGGFKLGRGAEEVRVVGHVEHGVVADGPRLALLAVGAVYEDGMARVDATGDLGIAAGAEDGRGAGVGVDAGEVRRRQREAAFGIVFDGGGVVEEEGAVGLLESPLLAAEDQGDELERGVNVLEEYLPRRRFSKSNRPDTRPLVETVLKKRAAVLSA